MFLRFGGLVFLLENNDSMGEGWRVCIRTGFIFCTTGGRKRYSEINE
jgi:hypothetical protein